jgi:hypothetical protein
LAIFWLPKTPQMITAQYTYRSIWWRSEDLPSPLEQWSPVGHRPWSSSLLMPTWWHLTRLRLTMRPWWCVWCSFKSQQFPPQKKSHDEKIYLN